jgi:hypothetical protein
MQISAKYLMISFVCLASYGVATARGDAPLSNKTIDGVYAEQPSEASDSGQMTVALAGLLLTSSRFEHVNITGKLERVKIASQSDSLRVIVFDSAGRAVVDDVVKAVHKQSPERNECILEREWTLAGSGESGAAAGKTTLTLSRDDDGSLRVNVVTVAKRTGFWSRKTPTVSRDWLKYPQARLPVPSSVPPKEDNSDANRLFGRSL